MAIPKERVNEFNRAALEFLADGAPRRRTEVTDHLRTALAPTPEESALQSDGRPQWMVRFTWASSGLVRAGFLTKDGAGVWTITPEGLQALKDYPDAATLGAEVDRRYEDWRSSRPRRRAWLLRGSSVLGVNVVPDWLAAGYCSLAGSQLRPLEHGIEADEVEAVASEDYGHLKHHELKAKVEEIVAFVTRMAPGDLVITTSDQNVFVGELTGDWTYETSDGGRSNLRRSIAWRNADAPIDYADLPAPLPARLQTGSTILDLTTDIGVIDSLGPGVTDLDIDDEDLAPELRRHDRLPAPSPGLATDLFVGSAWLVEVAELLDERRQVIFYGPPGTGKTWIARKLAADLVGPEQVKLVQFHPAYTYEDFFEGYRPVPGKGEGTISFELRAGPLRQLVNRAREHPEQAFVLIIDEINRANLAKVFGELYFLLEYRDQAVDLLYSADEEGFTLPTNLYVIGTMNTADRSIALVDAAMRRRFAFVELSPDTEPTKSLLAEWSAHHGLGTTAAKLLVELNRRIEDPDFRIGPSYFMKSTDPEAHTPDRLERTWRTSIVPLLQEHHYGQWDSVARRYGLASLLAAIEAGEATPTDEPEGEPGPKDPAEAE